MEKLKISEQNFVTKHWQPRESTFVSVYIKTSPNLGCNSTQRAESTYPITTTLLNHQLSLAEAAKRLNQGIKTLLRDLDALESESYRAFPRSFDLQAYSLLIGQVTKFAMEKVTQDWEACKQAVSSGITEIIANEQCSCELLLRFSLPCKHHLLQAARTGQPIPVSLFHPRWRLNGPPITKSFTPWKPSYGISTEAAYESRRANEITSSTL
jgi:hypothetical protein